MDVRLGALQLGGDPRQEARAVHEQLEVAPRPRRRIAFCPQQWGRLEDVRAIETAQPAAMMGADQRVHSISDSVVDSVERDHGG
jgi:hypothetical protein